MEISTFGKAITGGLSRKNLELALGGYHWLVIFGICPRNLEKQVGCPGTSVIEQALPDFTASILATFPRMSNMFLHFRQVIDSRVQKQGFRDTKLWKLAG